MMAVEIHLVMKLEGKTAWRISRLLYRWRVHRELSYGTTRMVMTQTGWQLSTIRFDQLEYPEEAGSMLRDLGRLLNRR